MNSLIGPVSSRTLTFWRFAKQPEQVEVHRTQFNVTYIDYIANSGGEVKIASAPSNLSASQPNRKEIANHSRENESGEPSRQT